MPARDLAQHLAARRARCGKAVMPERRIGDDGDAVLLAERDHLVLDRALPQMIKHLVAGDFVFSGDRQRFLEIARVEIADAVGKDFSLAFQFLERGKGFLERMLAAPMQKIAIEPVRFELGERFLAGAFRPLARSVARQHLRDKKYLVAAVGKRLPDQRLGAIVHFGGIDVIHAKVEPAPERRDRARAITLRDVPGALADPGNLRFQRAEIAPFHAIATSATYTTNRIREIRMRGLSLALFLIASILAARFAAAQDLPPKDVLEKIIPQLQEPLTAARIVFRPKPVSADPLCGMRSFEMTLERDDTSSPNKYSVALDPRQGNRGAPREILAVIDRLAVDADGAARAYHPEDVYGKGVCTKTNNAWRGICALDSFASSGIRIFEGASRVKFPSPSRQPEEVEKAATRWKEFWALIRARKLKSIDFKKIGGLETPEGYRMFYWPSQNLSAFFKAAIIPHTKDGYPCLRNAGERAPGYFIAATTLTQKGEVRADGCAPGRYIDALDIPFFVLPGGSVGGAEIGDIVIGVYRNDRVERIAYGIAADAGPIEQFGEGSVAFNQILLGQTKNPVMNIDDVNSFHISAERLKKDNATLAILVLGGTKQKLNGNYSRANIERVGRAALAQWNGGGAITRRLNACLRQIQP